MVHGYVFKNHVHSAHTTAISHEVTCAKCANVPRIKALKDAGDDPQKVGIMVASHNADTVRYGVNRCGEVKLVEHLLDWILSTLQYLIFPIYSGWRSWDWIPRREFCVSLSCSECVIR